MGSFPVRSRGLAVGYGLIIKSRAEPSRAEPSRAEPSRAEPSRAEPSHSYVFTPGGFLRRLVRRGPDAMGRAGHRPRERHSRLSFPRRRAAGPASPSLSSPSPRRAVRPAPGLRAAACLLAAALVLPGALLLSAGAAEAQSTVKLVATTAQTENTTDTNFRFINDRAQPFTTGTNATGYTLKRVDLPMSYNGHTSPTAPAYTVKIHNAGAAGPGGTVLGTLTNPSSVIDGTNSYTTNGIDLDPNTTYFVVIDVTGTGGNHHRISNDITDSDNEDSGARLGWSIADNSFTRQFESGGAWTSRTRSWKMAIRGVVKTLPPAPSGLLSNTGQAAIGGSNFESDTAQAFTTGSDPAKLTGLSLIGSKTSGSTPTYTVSIRQDSSGTPGSVVGTLTNPASLPSSNSAIQYAAPSGGIDLDANKTYWVVIDITSGGNNQVFVSVTTSPAEDAGAPAGWSIANTRLQRNWSGTVSWGSDNRPLKMAIQGYIRNSQPPPAPAAPTLSTDDGTELTITWKAPAAVLEPVTDYDVRYRRKGDTAWTEHEVTGAGAHSTKITGLPRGWSWEAQVAARNTVGPGQWSATGAGHTGPARFVSAETTASGVHVLITWTKVITGALTVTAYTLRAGGVDRTSTAVSQNPDAYTTWFAVNSADRVQAGQTVTVSYAKPSGAKLTDADGLEIANFSNKPVTNLVASAPAAPSAPTVSSVSGERALSVSWTAPADNNGAITDYDVRYFAGSADPSDAADWIEAGETGGHDHVGVATTAKITGLSGSTAYRVQVRAQNSAGEGSWSASGSATTVGSVPSAPAAPTVSAASSSIGLDVSWTAPATGGSAITGYELRYYAGSADPDDEADWVRQNEATGIPNLATNTATSATISGLLQSTTYQVQVRAVNANGDGPWSASGSAGTTAVGGTNSAPIRLRLGTVSQGCIEKTANTAFLTPLNVPAGSLASRGPVLSQAKCGSVPTREPAMFGDPDSGDTLTFTARVRSLPDNVLLAPGVPLARATADTVLVQAVAAFRHTNVTFDVTATDPHGETVSTFFIARVGAFGDTNGAPTFESQVETLRFAANRAIEPVVLPAATGGDVGGTFAGGGGTYEFPYTYEVEDLPAGLAFDAATRELSGTPTETGLFFVTYTAGDADSVVSRVDKASQTIRVWVGDGPRIDRVRIVSKPTLDSDNDGTADTYVKGDKIHVDVEFNAPVTVSDQTALKLRLDLGEDSDSRASNRETMDLQSVRHGGQTLRFEYSVGNSNNCSLTTQHGDCDPDGIWVQRDPDGRNIVLFPASVTITHAVTGEAADRTYRHLPTAGDPLHKVDGSKDDDDIGPLPSSATVNGDTLTVTFDTNLAALADADALRFDFFVRGAAGIGADDRTQSQSPSTVVRGTGTDADKLTLTLGVPALADETVTLTYLGTTLKGSGASGKRAPMFRGLAVTNNTPGTKGPALVHASVAGTKLRMVFGADLDTGSAPSGTGWSASNTLSSTNFCIALRRRPPATTA